MPIFKKALVFFILSLLSFCLSAQIFEKGKSYLNGNLALGGYEVNTQTGDEAYQRGTVAFSIPIYYEYALLNQVGIGANLRRSYFPFSDTLNTIASSSTALLFSNNLHLVNVTHIDLSLGISYGIGSFKLNAKTPSTTLQLRSFGFCYVTNLSLRTYFLEKRAGLSFNISYNNYSFDINRYKLNGVEQVNRQRGSYSISLSGLELGFGIAYKL